MKSVIKEHGISQEKWTGDYNQPSQKPGDLMQGGTREPMDRGEHETSQGRMKNHPDDDRAGGHYIRD